MNQVASRDLIPGKLYRISWDMAPHSIMLGRFKEIKGDQAIFTDLAVKPKEDAPFKRGARQLGFYIDEYSFFESASEKYYNDFFSRFSVPENAGNLIKSFTRTRGGGRRLRKNRRTKKQRK